MNIGEATVEPARYSVMVSMSEAEAVKLRKLVNIMRNERNMKLGHVVGPPSNEYNEAMAHVTLFVRNVTNPILDLAERTNDDV